MFAVPGWSVSNSELKQQTEPAPSKQASKKRKRENANANAAKGNVDEMYHQLIEAKDDKPKGEKGKGTAVKTAESNKKRRKEGKSKAGKADGGDSSAKAADTEQIAKDDSSKGADASKDKGNKKQKKKDTKDKTKNGQEQNGVQDQQQQQPQQENQNPAATETPTSTATAPTPAPPALTPLQQAMRQKLVSARFRHLNETLYTTDSNKAMELFSSSPELFDQYHVGFSQQVKEWPSNPVDGYIQAIQTRGKVSPAPKKPNSGNRPQIRPLPRRPNKLCTIADLGCGDARLARTLAPSAKQLNLKLLSYDLQTPDPLITKADISNLPTPDGSVDLAIFCLSLMGTNWVSFVEEAWRVLRGDGKGECWVSEVKSRFGKVIRKKGQVGAKKPALSNTQKKKLNKKKKRGDDDDDAASDIDEAEIYAENARPSDSKDDETDISAFVEVFRSRGFVLRPESVDKSNKMFVRMEFVKQGTPPTKGKYASAGGVGGGYGKKRFIEKPADTDYDLSPEEEAQVLKPCVYKTR